MKTGNEIRQIINEDGDPYLVKMILNLTDKQLEWLAELVKRGPRKPARYI